jgi:hypothetical protein
MTVSGISKAIPAAIPMMTWMALTIDCRGFISNSDHVYFHWSHRIMQGCLLPISAHVDHRHNKKGRPRQHAAGVLLVNVSIAEQSNPEFG